MDLNSIPMFGFLTQRMDWHSKRQDILAQNIANADTPHYQPHDLEPIDFDDHLRRTVRPVQVAMTNPRHLTGLQPEIEGDEQDSTYEVSPVGNAVSLEEQAVLVAENAMGHSLVTQLYGKNLTMLRSVMRSGS